MLDKLNFDVRETIDILDREILAVVHELLFDNIVGEMLDRLDPQVREAADHLHLDVCIVLHDLDRY